MFCFFIFHSNILDERKHREEIQQFESRLNEHDCLQSDYRILNEEIQRKRRILQDLENEVRIKVRKHAEQHSQSSTRN